MTRYLLPLCALLFFASFSAAQNPPAADESAAKAAWTPEEQARFDKLSKMLANVKLTGKFTIVGKEEEDKPPVEETYTIVSAVKAEEKNFWLITAKMKSGEEEKTIPMALPIDWAGDTPVISLTEFTIPLLGTFDCRVVFHDGKYAGTWRHGEVSGHLFGVISKAE
jgi:hypothetical protein